MRFVFRQRGEIERDVLGRPIKWDPEKSVESIPSHPEAERSFMQTVSTAVKHYARALKAQ
jgi:hypothetical protein